MRGERERGPWLSRRTSPNSLGAWRDTMKTDDEFIQGAQQLKEEYFNGIQAETFCDVNACRFPNWLRPFWMWLMCI